MTYHEIPIFINEFNLNSNNWKKNAMTVFFFVKDLFIQFIFGCGGSSLLCELSLVVESRSYSSSSRCEGFLLWWLLQSMGSRGGEPQ